MTIMKITDKKSTSIKNAVIRKKIFGHNGIQLNLAIVLTEVLKKSKVATMHSHILTTRDSLYS